MCWAVLCWTDGHFRLKPNGYAPAYGAQGAALGGAGLGPMGLAPGLMGMGGLNGGGDDGSGGGGAGLGSGMGAGGGGGAGSAAAQALRAQQLMHNTYSVHGVFVKRLAAATDLKNDAKPGPGLYQPPPLPFPFPFPFSFPFPVLIGLVYLCVLLACGVLHPLRCTALHLTKPNHYFNTLCTPLESRVLMSLKAYLDSAMEESELQALLKRTGVVVTKDSKQWDWYAVLKVIEGPLAAGSGANLREALKTKFIKRILSFLRPEKKMFADLDWTMCVACCAALRCAALCHAVCCPLPCPALPCTALHCPALPCTALAGSPAPLPLSLPLPAPCPPVCFHLPPAATVLCLHFGADVRWCVRGLCVVRCALCVVRGVVRGVGVAVRT